LVGGAVRIALAGDLCTLPSGYGKQIRELGERLVTAGFDVANFALQHLGPPRDVNGIMVHAFGDQAYHVTAIKSFRPDVIVHVRDNWALLDDRPGNCAGLRALARRHNSKMIAYTPVDNDHYPEAFVNSVGSAADLTLVTTDWGVEVLGRLGAPREKLKRLYPGVNPTIYQPSEHDPGIRERFGLPIDVPLFLQVATNWVNLRKMQPLTILAFRSFIERFDSEAILYIHSPAQGYFQLEEVVKAAGLWGKHRIALDSRVGPSGHMIGVSEEEMAALYRSATALVGLSSTEGFNSPMAEAASCGTPTIVTDFPVHREVLAHWSGRNHAQFVPARKILPHPIGYEWIAEPEAAADMMDKASHAPRGSGGVPTDLTWSALAHQLSDLCESVCR
jgi:glycosyltransferase involved in cell wall biosynthesis